MLADVCDDLKARRGCGEGTRHEIFMKKHCKKTCGLCDMLVMVTGGGGPNAGRREALDSVELLNMDGTWICPMPTLPYGRSDHTQSGAVICGGSGKYGVMANCTTLSSEWEKTHTLAGSWPRLPDRQMHSFWASPRGIMLIGGGHISDMSNSDTTEILTKDGDTIPGFSLDYSTM